MKENGTRSFETADLATTAGGAEGGTNREAIEEELPKEEEVEEMNPDVWTEEDE